MRFRTPWLTVLACLAVVGSARAQSYSLGVISQRFEPDARSIGMGGAFTALAEGPTAAWWNPAALGLRRDLLHFTAMPFSYRQLVPDLADDVWIANAAAAIGVPGFGFGFNLNYLSYGESSAIDINGNPQGTFDSHETTLNLGAGVNMSKLLFPDATWIDWGLGASWKDMHVDFGPQVGTGVAHDLDIGTLVAMRRQILPVESPSGGAAVGLRVGFVVLNALDNEIVVVDGFPSNLLGEAYRFGIAFEGSYGSVPRFGDLLQGRFAFDAKDALGRAADIPNGSFDEQAYGLEVVFLQLMSLRYGYMSSDSGLDGDTFGFGVHYDRPESRLGASIDFASIPQAEDLQRVEQYSLTAWGHF